LIDLTALVNQIGQALERPADFPRFPNGEPERKVQAIEAEGAFRSFRVFRSDESCAGSETDPIHEPIGSHHENSGWIDRAREVTCEERKTRKTRTNPCSVGRSSFPFLERETEKAEIPDPAGAPSGGSFDADDWRAAFDERAGVLEFDAGLPRYEAERLALQEIVAQYGPEPAKGRGRAFLARSGRARAGDSTRC
jgi:hypothetical protein